MSAGLLLAACPDEGRPADADVDTDALDVPADLAPAEYDGAWVEAFDSGDEGAFLSVWGTGASDVIAVGGQPGAGVAMGWDGSMWRALTIPSGNMLFWVHGVGDEVWMVGEAGRAVRRTTEATYEDTETDVVVDLWGVWAAAADDVWAVGGDARDREGAPTLLHWTGAWDMVALPELDRTAPALFKVWGTSSDNVYAVGSRGLLLHFDGGEWRQESAGTGEDLISLWGRGPDDIAVAGGRANGLLARWDGSAWTSQILVGVPGLNGVWMDGEGTTHMVGERGTSVRVLAGAFELERESTGSTLTVHGIWGVHGGIRFAVGGSLASTPPYIGLSLVDP